MNLKKNAFTAKLFTTLFLITLPMLSYADCADIKARYWRCTRASMIGEKCAAEDNVSISPECLSGGNTDEDPPKSSTSSSATDPAKDTRPFIYPKAELVPKKPVEVVNIKSLNTKNYIETEEDVEQFTSKIKTELSKAIKDGKKVRLQFN